MYITQAFRVPSRLLVGLALLAGALALGLTAHITAGPAQATQGLTQASIIRISSPRFT